VGTYYTRLRSINSAGASAPTPENIVVVRAGCSAPPPAPYGFAATINGRQLQFNWAVPDTDEGPTSLIVEVGSATGLANLGVIAIDSTLRSGTVLAPPGLYVARLRAHNACGTSAASNEIAIRVY
jgi:hypothetical protein